MTFCFQARAVWDPMFDWSRFSTVAQFMFEKNASMYLGRSAGL
jgi:hypothetical protein